MIARQMPRRSKLLAALLTALLAVGFLISAPSSASAATTTLKTYAAPTGSSLSTDYTVKVRTLGGSWVDLDEYKVRVGAPSRASWATFVNFDTDGPVEVSVTYNLGTASTATVKPSAKGITPALTGNTAIFSVSGPMKLVVDFNDNVDQDLMIFASPLESDVPSASDPNVVYYGPGFYEAGEIHLTSGQTLYLAGGAVVRGGIFANDVSNVTIRGRGILYQPPTIGVQVHRSNNVTIDGIIINGYGNANTGGYGIDIGASNNVTINNTTLFAYRKWTDGIDAMASNNISVNDAFIRTGDDSIAIYGTRWDHVGSSNSFNVTNSVLMPGNAHPINVGTHGNPDDPDTISDIRVTNVDILTHNPLYQVRSISITASDSNLVKDVLLSDIRWEDVLVGKFLDIITYKNPGYGLSVGRGIDGVTVKNFSYTGPLQYTNDIYGNSATRLTQNVAFENLSVNGQVATTAAAGGFAIGNYTSNITFAAGGGSPVQSGHVYKIVNANSNKVLGVSGMSTANNAQVIQWADNGTADHEWTLTQLPNGNYKITNANSGKVLGVKAMSTTDGTRVVQWTDAGTLDQEWQIVASEDGTYKLVNRYTSKALGILGMSTADGAAALQWADNGTADHNWTLVFVR